MGFRGIAPKMICGLTRKRFTPESDYGMLDGFVHHLPAVISALMGSYVGISRRFAALEARVSALEAQHAIEPADGD